MATKFQHTAEEAEYLINKIDPSKPSKYPAMSYEQGIEEVLLWLLDDAEKPEV